MDIQKVIEGLDALYADRKSEKVEDYLSANLEQALAERDVGSAITIINELIGFYRDASQYDKAQAYCEKLLPFMERAGLKDTIHYGTSCLNIANAYRASGNLETSLQYYQWCLISMKKYWKRRISGMPVYIIICPFSIRKWGSLIRLVKCLTRRFGLLGNILRRLWSWQSPIPIWRLPM